MCMFSQDIVKVGVCTQYLNSVSEGPNLGLMGGHLFGSGLQGGGIAAVAGLCKGPCARPLQLGQARQQLLLLLLRPQEACQMTLVSTWAGQIQRHSQEPQRQAGWLAAGVEGALPCSMSSHEGKGGGRLLLLLLWLLLPR